MNSTENYIMKRINIFLTVFLLALSISAFSQVKKANKHFELFEYAEAIPYYLKAVDSDNSNERSISVQRLADCYRMTRNFAEAKKWYEQALTVPNADPINYFYLGQSLRSLGMYNEAADAFAAFNQALPDSLNGERNYQYCIDIQQWLDLPEQAHVFNVEKINSEYSDFGPVFYNGELVFTSDRPKDVLDKNVYGWTNFGYLNLYSSVPEYSGNFWGALKEPQFMDRDFNLLYHDGPVCFSSDFSQVYITRTTTKHAKKEKGKMKTYLLQIYSAEVDRDGNVSKYKAFPFNSDEYSVAHPALSPGNHQIIFSSDMPGGFGGADLYVSTLVDGKWTEPKNLGANVNTEANEVFPYWADDSLLYFSSEGHLGYGGLDIFRSELSGSGWSDPENLKTPINSPSDDFGMVLDENASRGFFSSNRPEGKGADDIYAFEKLKTATKKQPVVQKERPQSGLWIHGFVKDKSSLEPIPEATVFMLLPNGEEVMVLKTDEDGGYNAPVEYDELYVVKAMKNGYIHDASMFRTPDEGVSDFTVPQDLLLSKLEVNQVFTINNIYYDLDKWAIRADAEPPLDNLVRIMKQYPIHAELSSHTDSRASFDYNMELSQKRAESAVRYMVLQGVDPSRITAKGYGETKLVNGCADGVPCTEEEHQANRRTEFKITEVDNTRSTYGEQFNLDLFKAGDVVSIRMFDVTFFDL